MTLAITNYKHPSLSKWFPVCPLPLQQRAMKHANPLGSRGTATTPGPPAALPAVPREPLLHISLGHRSGDHTFDTLCGVSQASPQGRSPHHRSAHISSLGSGSFLHSEYILLCWALTGAGKEADVMDMYGVLEYLWECSAVPRLPTQLSRSSVRDGYVTSRGISPSPFHRWEHQRPKLSPVGSTVGFW